MNIAERLKIVLLLTVVGTFAQLASGSVKASVTVQRDLLYADYGEANLSGDLYLPSVAVNKTPVVIMLHGGGWSGGERSEMNRMSRRIARSGFAVFNVSYRLAPRYRFPDQLEDLKRALVWVQDNAHRYNLDADRIGAWGYSAGAHLALLLGTVDEPIKDLTLKVKAVVAGAPPTDLREYPDSEYVRMFMPESADARLFKLASPVANVDIHDAPIFLYHGKRDRIVWIENSRRMGDALNVAHVEHQLFEMSFGHYLGFFYTQGAVDAGIEFLKRHLNP